MNITVLGSGGWGTALAMVLAENGHQVTLWSHRQETTDKMVETGRSEMLPEILLPSSLHFTTALDGVAQSGVVVFAVPSFAVRETAKQIQPMIQKGTVLVNASKGIEPESFLRLTQVMESELPDCPAAVLSGASHAEEVAKGIPTGVVIAADSAEIGEMLQDLFMNSKFRVYTSDDKIGTELGGALKNVMAICAGCCDGIGHGDNTKAMLITRGLTEMTRLGVALGAKRETFTGLAGLGDLIVTCTSMHSRNRRFGALLGEGKTMEEAKEQAGGVVEGYYAAAVACALAKKVNIEMPIAQAASAVLRGEKTSAEITEHLMQRAKRSEEESIWLQ